MTSLIEDIQRDAINPQAPVSVLLRKVKLAAAKLKLDTVERWVDLELKGYSEEGIDVPAYRDVSGIAVVKTLYHGIQPLQLNDQIDFLNHRKIRDPIGTLEHHLASNSDIVVPYPPDFIRALSEHNGGDVSHAGLRISLGTLVTIIDSVRTLVLEWSTKMESAGVTGQGMQFTEAEKSSAADAARTVINIGSISQLTGNVGVGNIAGDITSHHQVSIEQVHSLVRQVEAHGGLLAAEGIDIKAVAELCRALRSEADKPKPDKTLLSQLLLEISNKMKSAASSVVAQGIITLVSRILGLPAA